ncbi:MAG: type II toxin-antitoxin system RelE/ParE family toxin [Promethearchaeota archaeon]
MEDLKEIKSYIAHDSKQFANFFVDRIFQAVKILEDFPRIGKIIKKIHNYDYRMILFQKYRIIYSEIDNDVKIIRVLHANRLLDI